MYLLLPESSNNNLSANPVSADNLSTNPVSANKHYNYHNHQNHPRLLLSKLNSINFNTILTVNLDDLNRSYSRRKLVSE